MTQFTEAYDFRGRTLVDLARPTAVILGGEGAGLSQAVLGAADEMATIPMQAPVESLNVAIAAALILYEATRQRQLRKDARTRA